MRYLFVALGIAGCTGSAEGPEPGDGPGDTVDTTDSPPSSSVDGPTFVDDVRPLLAGTCVRCHGPSLLAPSDFLDYEVAKAWAEVMIDRVEAGEMPPAAADPECHPYQGDEVMAVTPQLVETLRAWVDAGKPSGDLTKPNTVEAWVPPVLPRHDLELRTAGPYAPEFVDGNEYRCFLLDDLVEEDTFVTGIEFLLDQPRISHHALLFIDPDAGSEQNIEDQASRSWRCASVQPEPNWSSLHAWAPSGGAVELDPGLGLRITAGSQIVLQMHYFEQGEPVADQPGYALMTTPTIDEEMYYLPVGPDGFTIPAGEPAHTESIVFKVSDWFGPAELHVYGVMPHMHVLGSAYAFGSAGPDADDRCISRSDAYDFAMQPTYWFDEPVVFQPDDRMSISCTYDNSAENPRQLFDPPVDVTWGENTQQEMCYALMYGVLR